MEIFLSAETEAPAAGYWLKLIKEIEPLLKKLETKNYGEELQSIGIISILLQKSAFEDGGYPERRYFSRKNKEADIRLRIDFKKFIKAQPEERRKIYVDHIIESIETLKPKVSRQFKYDQLISDVSALLKEDTNKI